MSGGKGGSTTSAQKIPQYIEDASKRNIARAEQAQQIGFTPYYGLDVAAFNPTQQLAAQQNIQAAQAFGMAPQGVQAFSGMPQAENVSGMLGYSSAPMYEQAVAAAQQADPTQAKIYDSLFGKDRGYS
tara:strand:+ start:142 stop:525 length:384 start_codon:yes stop_codon:yes gene_type:complete